MSPASESRPELAIPREARPSVSAPSMPCSRAARAAGAPARRGARRGGVQPLARHGADQAVAAHRGGDLAARNARAGELARVLDRVRALDAEADPVSSPRGL